MRYASCAKVTVRYRMTYMERTMTDNQIAKYLDQISKHCKAARANPTASTVHIDAIQDLAEHVVKTMKKERPDVTGAPV
jgi:phosphoribosylformylglycinamidine (FGAM) synthase-like amidotransferase family enzyme